MNQHRPDWLSLAFGVLFVALAVVVPVEDWISGDLSRWVVPGAVLVLGMGVAVSAIASTRS